MGPTDLFKRALQEATAVIDHVEPDFFTNPTPCDEWDMRTLVNHMLNELSWVPDLITGKRIDEVGDKYSGDLLGDDYKTNWHQAAERAQKTIDTVKPGGVAHVSYGDVPVEHYITEIGTDLLIHSWDVGQSMNTTLLIDGDLVHLLYDDVLPRADSFEKSGVFGKRVVTEPDIGLQAELLVIFGRPSETWSEHTRV